MIVVSFICMGNICRSPTAEAVFRQCVEHHGLSEKFHINSFATHSYHIGKPPDKRAISIGAKHGYDLAALRAEKISLGILEQSDYVLAMDKNNISKLQQDYGLKKTASVELLMKYHSTLGGGEVQDPYYEDELVFETVIELTRDAAEGLLNHIREQHQI